MTAAFPVRRLLCVLVAASLLLTACTAKTKPQPRPPRAPAPPPAAQPDLPAPPPPTGFGPPEPSTPYLPPVHLHPLPDKAPIAVKYYYGSLDHVNHVPSTENGFAVLSHFNLLVVSRPEELSPTAKSVLARLLAAGKQIYGYIHLAATLDPLTDAEIDTRIDQCAAAGYTGVFFDAAGYDYKVTRQRFNLHTQHAHDKGLHVIANAWHPDHVLLDEKRADMNPTGAPTALGPGDWILLESFYFRSDDYYAGEFGGIASTMNDYINAVAWAHDRNVRVIGLTYHPTTKPYTDTSDRGKSYDLALLLGLDGWAYGTSTPDNDLVPWTTSPGYAAGAGYLSDLRQVSSDPLRWERRTNRGVISFSATNQPAARQSSVEIEWERGPGGRHLLGDIW